MQSVQTSDIPFERLSVLSAKTGIDHSVLLSAVDDILSSLKYYDHNDRCRTVVAGWFAEKGTGPSRSFDVSPDGKTMLLLRCDGSAYATGYQIQWHYQKHLDSSGLSLDQKITSHIEGCLIAVVDVVGDMIASSSDAVVSRLPTVSHGGRRNLNTATKRSHIDATRRLGGLCPCCGIAGVVDGDGTKQPFAEFDHFYQNSHADFAHTWLICKPCHTDLTSGRVARHAREADFRAYQSKANRLSNTQLPLFEEGPTPIA